MKPQTILFSINETVENANTIDIEAYISKYINEHKTGKTLDLYFIPENESFMYSISIQQKRGGMFLDLYFETEKIASFKMTTASKERVISDCILAINKDLEKQNLTEN